LALAEHNVTYGSFAVFQARRDGSIHPSLRAAALVFPIPLLAFADPFDGGGDALVSRFFALGIGDPFNVLRLQLALNAAKAAVAFCWP